MGGPRVKCLIFVGTVLLSAVGGCSGGGGEDGGEGRTTDTGVRVVHAALDVEPVDLRLTDVPLQRARYADVTNFIPFEKGAQTLILDRANALGTTVANVPATLEKKVEYTLFMFGRAGRGTFNVALLADPVERPKTGRSRVQLLHGFEGRGPLNGSVGGVSLPAAVFSKAGGFVEVASGPSTITITDDDGRTVATVATELADRGELTVLVAGATDLGLSFVRLFNDLD